MATLSEQKMSLATAGIYCITSLPLLRAMEDSKVSVILLADRTYGRAIGTLLRLSSSSVCRLSVTLCIVAKRCVLEQKLLLRAYRKSYI